jgi:hypothetical protein
MTRSLFGAMLRQLVALSLPAGVCPSTRSQTGLVLRFLGGLAKRAYIEAVLLEAIQRTDQQSSIKPLALFFLRMIRLKG